MTICKEQQNNLDKSVKLKKSVKFCSDDKLNAIQYIVNRLELVYLKNEIWYSAADLQQIRNSGIMEVKEFMAKNQGLTFSQAIRRMHEISVHDDIIKVHIINGKMKYDKEAFSWRKQSKSDTENKIVISIKRSNSISADLTDLNDLINYNKTLSLGDKYKAFLLKERQKAMLDQINSQTSNSDSDSEPISNNVPTEFSICGYGNVSSAWE